MYHLACAFLILFLFACPNKKDSTAMGSEQQAVSVRNNMGSEQDDEPVKEDEIKQRVDLFLEEGLRLSLGNSLAEITAKLGEPLKKNIIEKKNIHYPDSTDQLYELFYEGLFIRIYHVSEMKRDLLVSLEVTSDKYEILFDLRIGSSKSKVLESLGPADEAKTDLLRYYGSEYRAGEIDFLFKDDKLVAICWYYFLD